MVGELPRNIFCYFWENVKVSQWSKVIWPRSGFDHSCNISFVNVPKRLSLFLKFLRTFLSKLTSWDSLPCGFGLLFSQRGFCTRRVFLSAVRWCHVSCIFDHRHALCESCTGVRVKRSTCRCTTAVTLSDSLRGKTVEPPLDPQWLWTSLKTIFSGSQRGS